MKKKGTSDKQKPEKKGKQKKALKKVDSLMYATEWNRITGNCPLSTVFHKTESNSQTRMRLEGGPGMEPRVSLTCWVWACAAPLAQSRRWNFCRFLNSRVHRDTPKGFLKHRLLAPSIVF